MVLPTKKMLELMNIEMLDMNKNTFSVVLREMGKNTLPVTSEHAMPQGAAIENG